MPHRVGFENCFPSDSLPCLGILFGRPLAAAAVGMATKRWQIIWNLLAICTDSGRVPLSALMRFHVPGFESWFFCFWKKMDTQDVPWIVWIQLLVRPGWSVTWKGTLYWQQRYSVPKIWIWWMCYLHLIAKLWLFVLRWSMVYRSVISNLKCCNGLLFWCSVNLPFSEVLYSHLSNTKSKTLNE